MMYIFIATAAPAALIVLWGIMLYNRFVRFRAMIEEAWSGIDVHLKQRHDLVPNLVATVRGYADHENQTLTAVTEARSRCMTAGGPQEAAVAESFLGQALGNLFALSESYPQLKADAGFRQLQEQLASLEDNIQNARRYYNGTVRQMNVAVDSFPSNIIAGRFKFSRADYFELEDAAQRAVPAVQF
jgi:LemA protein